MFWKENSQLLIYVINVSNLQLLEKVKILKLV